MAVAACRLLRTSKPLQFDPFSLSPSSSSSGSASSSVQVTSSSFQKTVGKKRVVVANASVVSENVSLEKETNGRVGDLASVAALGVFKPGSKRKSWQLQAEMLVECGILNCRFFTLFAVAGSLIGSILCFLEGCVLILESFYGYFRNMSRMSEEGQVMQLLVEALDLFLVGNAMLAFGVGMYVMFVGSKDVKRNNGCLTPESNLFGFFHLKSLPSWMGMQSLCQAKSRIGHSVLMILQAEVMDKFKNVPTASALDLACFAGTILLSSACIFLLSRLHQQHKEM